MARRPKRGNVERAILETGKLNILIDGQFGSTGKGLLAEYLALQEPCDFYLASLSPNAGHTFRMNGDYHVAKQLPVSGILHDRSTIYLTAGSIIDAHQLVQEVNRFNIDPERVIIHPRAAVVEAEDIASERDPDSSVAKIASTQSGVGAALARKVERSSTLAQGCPELLDNFQVRELDIMTWLDAGCSALMETCQGLDLSIDSGLSYPHCTSREVTVSAALASAQTHPAYLGKVAVCLRAYPIRVGHLHAPDGTLIGESGPFYPDSTELDWSELGVRPEKTTVTGRIRRIATFSLEQYRHMLKLLRPDLVFLNFSNYIRDEELPLMAELFAVRAPDLLGFGRDAGSVLKIASAREGMRLLETACGERARAQAGLAPRGMFFPTP